MKLIYTFLFVLLSVVNGYTSSDTNNLSDGVNNTSEKSRYNYKEKKRQQVVTKYPIVDGYPVWIKNPNIEGYKYTGIGFAKSTENISHQKRTARLQGIGDLSKTIQIEINNEISTTKVVDSKGNVISDTETYSRQKSNSLIEKVEEIDAWIDSNGDYYILLGIKGN